jgi:hypothetical protein
MVVSEGGDYVLNLKQRNYMSKSTKTKKYTWIKDTDFYFKE